MSKHARPADPAGAPVLCGATGANRDVFQNHLLQVWGISPWSRRLGFMWMPGAASR